MRGANSDPLRHRRIGKGGRGYAFVSLRFADQARLFLRSLLAVPRRLAIDSPKRLRVSPSLVQGRDKLIEHFDPREMVTYHPPIPLNCAPEDHEL